MSSEFKNRLGGGSMDVVAGTGFNTKGDATVPIPIVRVTMKRNAGGELTIVMPPADAQRIGLDMIAAGIASWHDAAIRTYAKEYGVDADTVIAKVRTLVDIALAEDARDAAQDRG